MGAAAAEGGRTAGKVVLHIDMLGNGLAEGLRDGKRGKLSVARQRLNSVGKLDACGLDLHGQIIRCLFDNVDPVHRRRELADLAFGDGPCNAQLENARFGHGVGDVLVDGAGADDAHFGRLFDYLIEFAGFCPCADFGQAPVEFETAGLGVCGHHDPLGRILGIVAQLHFFSLPYLDGALGVADAHSGADEEGQIETLGKLERRLGELKRLGRIAGFHHGNAGTHRVEAAILLVLAGMHARVVGCKHDQTTVHASVGSSEQRVRRYVDADVLHGAQDACTGCACTYTHLDGNLLIRCPLGIDAFLSSECLHGFG